FLRWGSVAVFVMPVPPFVRCCLRITWRRILPLLLSSQRSYVQVVPSASHLLVAAVIDKVCAEHAVAFAEKRVCAVPLINTEVFVEVVRDSVPRHVPAHPRLESFDLRLWRA